MTEQTNILWYVHDPMCSWCWGFKNTWKEVKDNLPNSVMVKNLVGGLAPDSDFPMPENTKQYLQSAWQKVAQTTGATLNFEFWQKNIPRRSTYPACRAVIASSKQNAEEAMIEAIQHAYYLEAKNPSDLETLIACAEQIGLDLEKFQSDIANTDEEFHEQMQKVQQLGTKGFPSLALETPNKLVHISINYTNPELILNQITKSL